MASIPEMVPENEMHADQTAPDPVSTTTVARCGRGLWTGSPPTSRQPPVAIRGAASAAPGPLVTRTDNRGGAEGAGAPGRLVTRTNNREAATATAAMVRVGNRRVGTTAPSLDLRGGQPVELVG